MFGAASKFAWTRVGDQWERKIRLAVGMPWLIASVAEAKSPGNERIYVPQLWVRTPTGERNLLFDGPPVQGPANDLRFFEAAKERAEQAAATFRRLIMEHPEWGWKPHHLYYDGLGGTEGSPLTLLNVCARVMRRSNAYWIELTKGRSRVVIVRDGPFANPSVATDHVAETLLKIGKGGGFGCVCR